jgi:hypothetical protein
MSETLEAGRDGEGEARAACFDCGRRYGEEFGFPDLIVPHEIWNHAVSPTGNEGGLLCPSCLCARAHWAGLSGVPARFTSGPFAANAHPRVSMEPFPCPVGTCRWCDELDRQRREARCPNRPRGDLWALLGTALVCLALGALLWWVP